jgi:hypothetical protein
MRHSPSLYSKPSVALTDKRSAKAALTNEQDI